jgi:hypothetical protein
MPCALGTNQPLDDIDDVTRRFAGGLIDVDDA